MSYGLSLYLYAFEESFDFLCREFVLPQYLMVYIYVCLEPFPVEKVYTGMQSCPFKFKASV